MAAETSIYHYKAPEVRPVQDFYNALLGRPVTVLKTGRVATGPKDDLVYASYKAEDGQLVGVAVADFGLSVAFGACLALFPPFVVQQAKRSNKLDEGLWENLYEVLNVSCRFFHDPGFTRMIALDQVKRSPSTPMDPAIADFLKKCTKRTDFSVKVAGYDGGGLAIFGA
jgi:hypothetical protein